MNALKIIIVLVVAYSAYDYGKSIGLAEGAIEERHVNRKRLESCQRLAVANMLEVTK